MEPDTKDLNLATTTTTMPIATITRTTTTINKIGIQLNALKKVQNIPIEYLISIDGQ